MDPSSARRTRTIYTKVIFKTLFNEPVIKNQQECKDILLEVSKVHLRRGRLSPSASSLRERFVRARQQIGSNKIVIVVGGQAPKTIHNVDAYDPTTMQWTFLSPLSQRRCRCGVAPIGRHIYAVGGSNGALMDAYLRFLTMKRIPEVLLERK
ncbi:unnamed protein product, partial [Mesorhabditis belari]|uniref:Uncharacterized protein n=1 Tax=Mesorhabditis belari TaxID=2138241 RepID=A0AAF3EY59_9BILA